MTWRVDDRACDGQVMGKHSHWKQIPGKVFSVMTFLCNVTDSRFITVLEKSGFTNLQNVGYWNFEP